MKRLYRFGFHSVYLFVFLALLLVGCGKRDEAGKPPVATPSSTSSGSPAEETPEQKEARLKKKFEEFKGVAETRPEDTERLTALYNELIKEAAGTPMQLHIERVMTNARDTFEARAEEAYRRLFERINSMREKYKAEQLLPADMADKYAKLAAEVDTYPVAYRVTKWWGELQRAREEVMMESKSAKEWADLKADASRDADSKRFEEAVKKLERFPEKYRSTVWEKERQELLKTYKEAIAKRVEVAQAEEKLEWKEIFSGEPIENTVFNIKETDTDRWSVKEKVLVCDNSAGDKEAWLCTPKETKWRNFVMEVEFRFVTHGTVVVCVHGTSKPENPDVFTFDQQSITSVDFAPGHWHTMKIRVRNKQLSIESSSLVSSLEKPCEREDGVFALIVTEGTKVEIRKMRMALYSDK
ncbi:MAG: hypothetical protein N2234_01700 [Planctomycetota bacterium]|nr:hypothetical protein [Planctomycetota bacterium]